MKTSIVIPFLNEEKFLPQLLNSLKPQLLNDRELILIDNGSSDSSKNIVLQFTKKNRNIKCSLLSETNKEFAAPLNKGIKKAKGKNILFLDADTFVENNLIAQHEVALEKTDISVGNTKSKTFEKPTNYGKISCRLFAGHSERTAKAVAHALPWGPTCNLGVKKSLFRSVGLFSSAAAGAMDIDWCWRAVLYGYRIQYSPRAKLVHFRRNTRREIIDQFDRYGKGEAWLHQTYQFLTEDRPLTPLEASLEAFQRIQNHSNARHLKACKSELEEVSVAFASGVRAGYETTYKKCSMKRFCPKKSIGWPVKPLEWVIFVPKKGIVNLSGEQLELWKKMNHMQSVKQLTKEFEIRFHLDHHTAHTEAQEFWKAFQP